MKVSGLVNSVDLFTKHLTSSHRINQVVELFNCEYRDGRSSSAPELRKQQTTPAAHAVKAEVFEDVNCNSAMHDPRVLPHMYNEADMNKTFEKAIAPKEADCAPSGKCICGRPECRVCFPPIPPEIGPPLPLSEVRVVTSLPRLARSMPA